MNEKSGYILVVDDEAEIRAMLSEYLGKHGFLVFTAESAAKARKLITSRSFELAILDITMPGEDGLSLARYIRENHPVAIIMLTSADSVVDRIVGLEIGADDYLTKPCDPRELVARIRSVLRRARQAGSNHTGTSPKPTQMELIRFGCCWLNLEDHRLRYDNGEEIAITNGEFELLRVFATNPKRVLTRDQILDLIQKRDCDPFDRSVDIRIARVRKKIEPDPERPRFIKTIWGAGYRFVPDGE